MQIADITYFFYLTGLLFVAFCELCHSFLKTCSVPLNHSQRNFNFVTEWPWAYESYTTDVYSYASVTLNRVQRSLKNWICRDGGQRSNQEKKQGWKTGRILTGVSKEHVVYICFGFVRNCWSDSVHGDWREPRRVCGLQTFGGTTWIQHNTSCG